MGTGTKRGRLGLRELRQQRGLTQEAVALLGGIDTAQVSRIERGLAKPRPITVVRLARGLGIRVATMEEILANPASVESPDEPVGAP